MKIEAAAPIASKNCHALPASLPFWVLTVSLKSPSGEITEYALE